MNILKDCPRQWSEPSQPYRNGAEIEAALRRALRPDPLLTVSEWADTYRRLSPKLAAEPGPYRTNRTPYLREIMDALSPMHPARRIAFMKGSQVGATEAGNNWLGYIIHWTPAPTIAVLPTVETAERSSKQRIEPLIEESPELRALIPPARSRDSGNTLRMKEFPNGVLVITGANSAVGLRSMPARFAFLDEVDAYPGDVDEEGDPIDLVRRRVQTFGRFGKMFLVSTPTVQGVSRIEREYEASDQRRYFIPCPHCSEMQWLKFERLRWEKGEPETVHYVCEGCDKPIEERHKAAFLDAGEWRATAESADDGLIGFHISGLYSPLGWLSWQDIAQQWEDAQGNEASLKAFKNTVLGETWQEKGEAPEWKRIAERKEEYRLGTVSRDILLLTAGVDVQRDRIEAHIWGWGRNLRSQLVDVRVLEGDTADEAVWHDLGDMLSETWEHESGARLAPLRWAIDSGDGVMTSTVYSWARSTNDPRVMPIKGKPGFDRSTPVHGPTYVDVTERGKKIMRGIRIYTITVDVFKAETYRFLRLDRPTEQEIGEGVAFPAGYVHIPSGTSDEWVKQLTSEHLVAVENKRTKFKKLEWRKLRDRNEALDARVYARAAAWVLGVDRWDERHWKARELEVGFLAEQEPEDEPPRQVMPFRPPPVAPRRIRRSTWMA